MKIPSTKPNYKPCPEYTGRAICVDSTPLQKQQTQFGEREVSRFVFETEIERDDGVRHCVRSRGFTLNLNEKSSLRKLLRGWNGRDLTKEEIDTFDTDHMIGKTANIVVMHEHKDGEIYANIVACTPDKSTEPLTPSGKYIRVKDRPPKDVNSYQRAEQPSADDGDLGATKIHVGRCAGLEIRDLAPEQVGALIEHWLPTAKSNPKPTADDKRLIAALEQWQAAQAAKPAEDDSAPY